MQKVSKSQKQIMVSWTKKRLTILSPFSTQEMSFIRFLEGSETPYFFRDWLYIIKLLQTPQLMSHYYSYDPESQNLQQSQSPKTDEDDESQIEDEDEINRESFI